MSRRSWFLIVACAAASCSADPDELRNESPAAEFRWITLDPAHFHAALVQKEILPGVSPDARLYAPLGPDLAAHLARVARFPPPAGGPTGWSLSAYAGPDFLERFRQEPPGGLVVISGRNRRKLEYIEAAVGAGMHVLADKPWILEARDLGRLEAVFAAAATRGVVALDAMTQRFEVAFVIQRELVRDVEVFGEPILASSDQPAVELRSVHHLLKLVAGTPNLRPAWFFDTGEQGEGLTDVGTHLVDLVQWTLLAGAPLDPRSDVEVLDASHWPTVLSKEEFRRVTGEADFPSFLADRVRDGRLEYLCNDRVSYTLRGIHVRLEVRWEFEAPPGGGDNEVAVYRGTRSRVEVRGGPEEGFVREVFVIPATPEEAPGVKRAVAARIDSLKARYAGLAVDDRGDRLRIVIPPAHRVAHEDHFALLVEQFLRYARDPTSLPAWEMPYMLAKYRVTTEGVELARGKGVVRCDVEDP